MKRVFVEPVKTRADFEWTTSKLSDPAQDSTEYINTTDYQNLQSAKSDLDFMTSKEISKARSAANPLEILGSHIFINRAALKSAEIDSMFSIIKNSKKLVEGEDAINILDLAAGPGGFSEYFLWRSMSNRDLHERVKNKNNSKQTRKLIFDPVKVSVNAVTLRGKDDFRVEDFNMNCPVENFKALYGEDDTGNITHHCVQREIYENGPYQCVWADGGLDCRGNENFQEFINLPLVACELSIAMMNLVNGGTVVCKLYTTHETPTAKLINLVGSCFSRYTVVKPVTSRPGNSEQYGIFEGYEKDVDVLKTLVQVTQQFLDIDKSDTPLSQKIRMMVSVEMPLPSANFNMWLKKLNKQRCMNQISALKKIKGCCDKDTEPVHDQDFSKTCFKQWGLPISAKKNKRRRTW